MKTFIVLLAIALVANAEVRPKRATTVVGYVTSSGGCTSLTGKVASYCNLGYQTPASIATQYSTLLQPMVDGLNGLTGSCKTAMKEILCKSYFPKCSSDGSTAQYQAFTSSCNGIGSCSGVSGILGSAISTTTLCAASGSTRTINLKSCTAYTTGSSINSNICGSLPKNITFTTGGLANAVRNSGLLSTFALTFLGVTGSCKTQWEKFLCVQPEYCGTGSQVLSAVTKQQCESAINCLPGLIKPTYSAMFTCSNFPDQSATRVCVSDSAGFKPLDPSVTTCNSASAVAIGSTLFYLVCAFLAYFH